MLIKVMTVLRLTTISALQPQKQAAVPASSTAAVSQVQPVMLKNAAFEENGVPNMFDDEEEDESLARAAPVQAKVEGT